MTKSLKSSAKTIAVAALLAASAGGYAVAADMPVKAPPAPKAVPFFFVNDNSVSFTYYFNATDPGISGNAGNVAGGIPNTGMTTMRAQGAFDHFDVWEYGTNLIHLEIDQYGKEDPIQTQPGASGSREFFGFSRSTLGFNELSHSKTFDSIFTNDVGFEFGFTAGTQNNFLAEETTQYVLGLNFDLKIPKPLGIMLLGVLAYNEHTHNEFQSCNPAGGFGVGSSALAGGVCAAPFAAASFSGDRQFKWAPRLEVFNSIPLGGLLGSWADGMHIVNILNVTFPKGTGISTANMLATCGLPNNAVCLADDETKTEVFEDARLSFDTSKIFWGKPGIWDTYVGYRYWYNKFGTDHNAPLFGGNKGGALALPFAFGAPGTSIESTAYVGTTYHFK